MTHAEPPPSIDELERDPPAVANLLLHNGAPNGDALAATVLDLAARHVVEFEEISPTEHLCHVPHGASPLGLAPFELRVFDLLRERAVGGTVPAGALTVGIQDETDDWWRAFVVEVSNEANHRGYLSDWLRVFAWSVAVVFVIATWYVISAASAHHTSGGLRVAAISMFAACMVGAGLVTPDVTLLIGRRYRFDPSSRLQRLSQRGHREARWWHHARHLLGADQAFSEERAAGVAIWSRYVPYAVALGLAPTAAHDVPIGPDGAGSTFVRRGDMWHRIHVRYPKRIPPGWGFSPLRAGLAGAASMAVCGTLLLLASRNGVWFPHPPFAAGVARIIGDLELAIAGLAVVGFVLGAWELVLAVRDFVHGPIRISGVVVARRLRGGRRWNPWGDLIPQHWYVVVDDGASTRLDGLRIPRGMFEWLDRGDSVEVTVSPYLRHVQHVTVVHQAKRTRRPPV